MGMRVSLSMIVKNEARTLAVCLDSVADLVSEIVVVDTGSDDDTLAVARHFGAKVHPFAWVDDFAAARNESLRHATGEWILWLDGDESVDTDNRARLRALLDGLEDENAAYLMRQRSLRSSVDGDAVFSQCRLFRNLPSIRWRYRVHEQIQPAVEASGGMVRATEIFIEHTGYDDASIYRQKLHRNVRLLLLEDRERPNDPFTLMNLGWAYKDLGHVAAALGYYGRALERCKPGMSILTKLYALMVRGHLALGQRQQALAACRAGRNHTPDDVELSFLEAVLLSELGDLSAAEAGFVRLLEKPPADPQAFGANPGMRGHMARHNLARVYRAQGRATEAEAQWRAALAERPDSVRSLFELGLLYLEQRRTDETEPLLQQLARLGPVGEIAATMLRAERQLRLGDVASARRLLELAVANGPPALEPRLRLSRLLMEHGADPAETAQALRGVLAIDPNHTEARRQLLALVNKHSHRLTAEPEPVGTRRVAMASQTPRWLISNDAGSHRSAREVVPHILELLRPKSVVDVGCGLGSWLAVFREHGVHDFFGVDAPYVNAELLRIPRERFIAHDLTQPLEMERRFDLALALEVAEHLAASDAANFVASLVRLAPVVVFSAAIPFQGGNHHLNEQWPDYWIKLFERHGYVVVDGLRDKVWANDRVEWWYCQNLLLFCSPAALVQNAQLRRELASTSAARMAVVHPRLYLQAVGVIKDLQRQLAELREKKPATGNH